MNTTTTVRRHVAACAVLAVVLPAFAACGAELTPPAQQIGRHEVQKQEPAVRQPVRINVHRFDFGDEAGEAHARKHTHLPAGSGTRNRMDFGDKGW